MKYKKLLLYGSLAVLALLTLSVLSHSLATSYSGLFMD